MSYNQNRPGDKNRRQEHPQLTTSIDPVTVKSELASEAEDAPSQQPPPPAQSPQIVVCYPNDAEIQRALTAENATAASGSSFGPNPGINYFPQGPRASSTSSGFITAANPNLTSAPRSGPSFPRFAFSPYPRQRQFNSAANAHEGFGYLQVQRPNATITLSSSGNAFASDQQSFVNGQYQAAAAAGYEYVGGQANDSAGTPYSNPVQSTESYGRAPSNASIETLRQEVGNLARLVQANTDQVIHLRNEVSTTMTIIHEVVQQVKQSQALNREVMKMVGSLVDVLYNSIETGNLVIQPIQPTSGLEATPGPGPLITDGSLRRSTRKRKQSNRLGADELGPPTRARSTGTTPSSGDVKDEDDLGPLSQDPAYEAVAEVVEAVNPKKRGNASSRGRKRSTKEPPTTGAAVPKPESQNSIQPLLPPRRRCPAERPAHLGDECTNCPTFKANNRHHALIEHYCSSIHCNIRKYVCKHPRCSRPPFRASAKSTLNQHLKNTHHIKASKVAETYVGEHEADKHNAKTLLDVGFEQYCQMVNSGQWLPELGRERLPEDGPVQEDRLEPKEDPGDHQDEVDIDLPGPNGLQQQQQNWQLEEENDGQEFTNFDLYEEKEDPNGDVDGF